ncbi:hypothetical protein BC936DRAFT_141086 [Jimgerdemannia flammicorona]|uniref:Zn(2)-C6 fungal-type domain-containing protein n=1 Tax=Jimgerdemannia flammicorona TaxID=994334 RepID=A0A433A2X5_9FUNG|nr:hypothetical protein BC936DRAFT_141086 [Jimgerdemannia flammicorona]
MSFSYRDVQQIWNSKSDGEACARCRDRRSRCDGRFPCGRCAKARLECVYSGWIDEEDEQRTEKMVREVEALEEAFERLGGEMMRIRAESEKVAAASMGPIPESKGGEEEEKEEKVSRVVSGRREYARSEQWIVTLGKRGVRVQTDIRMMRQLHEFLKNLAPGVCRGPAMGYRSVGTSAMLVRFTSQWRRWHDTQVYQFPNDPLLLRRAVTVPFGITPKFKDLLLERIVVQSFECRPWGRMTTSEQQNPPPPPPPPPHHRRSTTPLSSTPSAPYKPST